MPPTRSLLLLFFACLPFSPQAQLSLELGSGAELGWWVYNKGFNDSLPLFHQGYDRSHLAFILPAELSLTYQLQKWSFSLGGRYRYFDDNVLIGSDNARGNYSRYRLQQEGRGVHLWEWQARLQYHLINRARFSVSPFVSGGSFHSNATIPKVLQSRRPWQVAWGLDLSTRLGQALQLYFRPRYARMHIAYDETAYHDEQQNVYSIGILTGIRISI